VLSAVALASVLSGAGCADCSGCGQAPLMPAAATPKGEQGLQAPSDWAVTRKQSYIAACPPNWHLTDLTGPRQWFCKENNGDDEAFAPNCNIVIEDWQPDDDLPLVEAYWERNLKDLSGVLPSFTLESTEVIEVADGRQGIKARFAHTHPGAWREVVAWYFSAETTGVAITCTTFPDMVEVYLPVFDLMTQYMSFPAAPRDASLGGLDAGGSSREP
jgi:hypothetical protein